MMYDENSTKNDVIYNILHAAIDTIATEKISGTNLRDIAARAGISQGTLHYYFPSKIGLYQAVLEYMSNYFVKQREKMLMDSNLKPRDKLNVFFAQMGEVIHEKNFLLVFYDFWVQGAGKAKDLEIQEMIQKIYDRWRGDIDKVVLEGVAQGKFDSKHAKLIPHLMVSLMEGAALQAMIDSEVMDLDAYFKSANQFILNAIEIR
jgi:AcrR family transcriptional regulator